MSRTQLSLSWDTFKSNICDGLSSYQQREEFVDMTLAADGHVVKVHQMIISLASPYLKELIKSAPCPHPVLFLNNISHRVLCGILEYIYCGEVIIDKEDIDDLIQAGKALHIRGLEDMNWSNVQVVDEPVVQSNASDVKIYSPAGNLLKKRKIENSQTLPQGVKISKTKSSHDIVTSSRSLPQLESNTANMALPQLDSNGDVLEDPFHDDLDDESQNDTEEQKATTHSTNDGVKPIIQYTLSNQGHIQMILNRYMYSIAYRYKNSNARLWKCVDGKTTKCPAQVTTNDDIVVQRVGAHTHLFHDKRILKKVEAGMVLTAIKDAEIKGKEIRENNKN